LFARTVLSTNVTLPMVVNVNSVIESDACRHLYCDRTLYAYAPRLTVYPACSFTVARPLHLPEAEDCQWNRYSPKPAGLRISKPAMALIHFWDAWYGINNCHAPLFVKTLLRHTISDGRNFYLGRLYVVFPNARRFRGYCHSRRLTYDLLATSR